MLPVVTCVLMSWFMCLFCSVISVLKNQKHVVTSVGAVQKRSSASHWP